jgi:hyperosmotically inducible periplasmic protein
MQFTQNLTRVAAVGFIAVGIGVAGCKSTGGRSTGQKMNDRSVARGVSHALAKDPTFKYSDVHANVYDGNIQLTGFVETTEQRLRAAELASHVQGAKQVINEIMIKPMATGPVTIRDPLGHETGRVLVDTNAPLPRMRNLTPSPAAGQQPEQGAGSTPEETNPKQ